MNTHYYQNVYRKWLFVAKENGISNSCFNARVNKLKWEPERAATTKVGGKK